jgi:hypothetical protein
MSALSNLTQTSGTSTTTLPAWYGTAQQNLVTGATNAAAAAPQLNQTVAQGAINTLSGPNNPFTSATNTLGSIAAGAANPWITNPDTGAVTPNTNTAMGGLFAAQRDQLQREMPYIQAGAAAPSIGSGNFGSLRGQVATNVAMGDAMNKLFTNQQQAALQNQQTGVTAAANQGNVAQQGITNAMNVGQQQMVAPFTTQANLGNILASINAPATVNTTQTPSNLAALTGLGSAVSGGLNALYAKGTPGTSGYVPGVLDNLGNLGTSIKGLFGSSPSTGNPSLPPGMTQEDVTAAQNGWIKQSDGSYLDSEGNPVDGGNPYMDTGPQVPVTGADDSGGYQDGYVQNPYGEGYVDPAELEYGP